MTFTRITRSLSEFFSPTLPKLREERAKAIQKAQDAAQHHERRKAAQEDARRLTRALLAREIGWRR